MLGFRSRTLASVRVVASCAWSPTRSLTRSTLSLRVSSPFVGLLRPPPSCFARRMVRFGVGNMEGALEALEKAVLLDGENEEAHLIAGHVLVGLANHTKHEAVNRFEMLVAEATAAARDGDRGNGGEDGGHGGSREHRGDAGGSRASSVLSLCTSGVWHCVADFHVGLGAALMELGDEGRRAEATHNFHAALALNPDHPEATYRVRGGGQGGNAAKLTSLPSANSRLYSTARGGASSAGGEAGECTPVAPGEACAAGGRITGSAVVRGHGAMAAAAAPEQTAAPEQKHIADIFNAHARTFDALLVRRLRYKVPWLLEEALQHALASTNTRAPLQPPTWRVLDLGAGTGLLGPLLRPMAGTLTGVDLSENMLNEAQKTQAYDRLVVSDIVAYLEHDVPTASVDLMVATDVVVYFSDLRPLFAAAGKAARSGGFFALSTEDYNNAFVRPASAGRGGEEPGYIQRSSARFAHSTDYVRRLATGHGFSVVGHRLRVGRYENWRPVPMGIWILIRK